MANTVFILQYHCESTFRDIYKVGSGADLLVFPFDFCGSDKVQIIHARPLIPDGDVNARPFQHIIASAALGTAGTGIYGFSGCIFYMEIKLSRKIAPYIQYYGASVTFGNAAFKGNIVPLKRCFAGGLGQTSEVVDIFSVNVNENIRNDFGIFGIGEEQNALPVKLSGNQLFGSH